MDFITLRDFARQKGVTYEAIRRQASKYENELRGHIVIRDRTKYLDEYAQEFLSERRRLSPVVVKVEENQEELEELRSSVESLRAKLALAQDELLKSQARVISLQDERTTLIESSSKYAALLEDHEALKDRLEESDRLREEAEAREADGREKLEELRRESDRELGELRRERDEIRREASEQAARADQELEAVRHERDAAQKEAASFTRSWFGFYRKKKGGEDNEPV